MKKFYTLSIIFLASLSFGQTLISLIGVNIPYNEDFSGMGSVETDFIPGWTAINVSNGSTLSMTVTEGSASIGNIFNVGAVDSEDRAFGTLSDGSTVPAFGAVFTNNTGQTASKIAIQTRMEQWKTSGNDAINETVAFSYSLDATSLNTGTWTTVTALNLKEKLTAETNNLAINGNLASNYTLLSNIITGLNWADGTNLWFKWTDANDAGSNGLYAIDNFTISISETLGVKQNAITGLKMYPNPISNGTLYITSNSNQAKTVAVYDILGKHILESKTSNNAVNVSDLKNGTYIVRITEEGKTDTRKLIIE